MSIQQKENDQIAILAGLLKRKRNYKFYAEKMGLPENRIKVLIKKARNFNKYGSTTIFESNRKENLEKGTMESVLTLNFEPKDHRELAKLHKIDLTRFVITNYWSKLKPNGHFTSSVFSKRKTPNEYSLEEFTAFLKTYKPNYIPDISIDHFPEKELIDVELSVSDLHLAKKYVDQKNLNVKKRAIKFFEIVEKLIKRTINFYNIDQIVFPISNDFFHTDTYWNTSTKGTPQDVIAEYDEEYEAGFDLLVRCIILFQALCNKVIVVLVPGNHDKTKGFYLAHGLSAFFKGQDDIVFLRSKENEKSVVLGNTFIGYHHGNCKIEDLPLLFATHERDGVSFGKAKFREVHTGDKHHYMAKEVKGVRIQQMPSMSGNDRWHKENLYVHNLRAALLLMYDKQKGKVGELEERL